MPYKCIANDSLLRHVDTETTVPYAGNAEEGDVAPSPCYRWSKEDIVKVNALIKGGLTPDEAIRSMSDEALHEVVEVDPNNVPFKRKAALGVDKMPKEQGEGVSGVTYMPVTRRQQRHRDLITDNGLGFTHKGIAIQPRRKARCKEGHLVAGDNVVVNAGSGQQNCKTCSKDVRRSYHSRQVTDRGGSEFKP